MLSYGNVRGLLCLWRAQAYQSLSNGDWTFSVRGIDAANNTDPSPPSHTWAVSGSSPYPQILSGPSGPVSNSTASISFTSQSATAQPFQCALQSKGKSAGGGSSTTQFAPCSSPEVRRRGNPLVLHQPQPCLAS